MTDRLLAVRTRRCDGALEERAWPQAEIDWLQEALPWRTFRWHHGQKHFPGTYWCATEQDHVIYESRLELRRLVLADFDTAVHHIVAQPFLLTVAEGDKTRKHIPDYLLITDTGPVVVDVKPQHRVSKPEVARIFGWTRAAVESRGWTYEVWSGTDSVNLENLRLLAGFRRHWLFNPELLSELRKADLDGVTLGDACQRQHGWAEPLVRAGVLHLLWTHELTTELSRPLSADHLLRRTA